MNKISKANVATAVETATTLGTKTAVPFTERDGKTLFLAENTTSSAVNLVIEAGDGIQSTEDLTLAVPASGSICFALESGKYKKLYGTNKGKILATGSGVSLSTFVLP